MRCNSLGFRGAGARVPRAGAGRAPDPVSGASLVHVPPAVGSLGVIPPDPTKDVGEDRAAMVVRMAPLAEDGFHVVTLLLQGRDHRLILQVPVAPGIARVPVVVDPI